MNVLETLTVILSTLDHPAFTIGTIARHTGEREVRSSRSLSY
jgi:hypothetical protein